VAHLLRQRMLQGVGRGKSAVRSALAAARIAHRYANRKNPVLQPPAGSAYPTPPASVHSIAQAPKALLITRLPKLPKVP
jgi:hypothetical protein